MDSAFLATYVGLWIVVVLLVLTLVTVVRELALIRMRLGPETGPLATTDGPKIGSVAPALEGTFLSEGSRSISRGPAIVVFVSPGCRPCRELLPHVAQFVRRERMPVYVVVQATEADARSLLEVFEIKAPVVIDPDHKIEEAFNVHMTPFALAMDEDWTVRTKGVTNDDAQLEALAGFHVTLQGSRPWVPREGPLGPMDNTREAVGASANVVGGELHGSTGP
jgi:methylamine dehydrogenase accessory protein MauD